MSQSEIEAITRLFLVHEGRGMDSFDAIENGAQNGTKGLQTSRQAECVG